ncbi:peptidase [Sinorhizobium americanum]|uniref:Peptidase n=1 Tax=Sinorhizobium americanum TaxID=194963 RepID=A0A2S3YJU9_9HYPH|nr:peptidase [Sinorhizobium americanum]POH29471.1 peptidase [Sinorhizobium americanum]
MGNNRVNTGNRPFLLLACLGSLSSPANADWQAVETVKNYAITGQSGPELYASIGEHGPKLGPTRAIAHTSFKLTWSRKYEAHGDACVLVSALPKLAITYTLPKPSKPLPAGTREHWETFIDGVHEHELVHGDFIKDMVKKIEAATVGLTVPADPQCRKIKSEMTKRLGALSNAQRQQSRDFDRAELSDGGKVHQLILNLVNGG